MILVKFLGHTGILIRGGATQLVIDPNFSHRVLFLKRCEPAVFDPAEIKKTDAILVSSAHLSRMDIHSYKYFPQKTRMILPAGTQGIVSRFLAFPMTQLKSDDQTTVEDLRITALASPHRAARLTSLRYGRSLNYLIETGKQLIFYGTDSPYGKHFAEIGHRFKINLAILPIGHVAPDFWAGKRYMTPTQALQAFVDLGAETLIPNAYGAFAWDSSTPEHTRDSLNEEIFKQSLRGRVKPLKAGETLELTDGSRAVS